MLRKCIAGMLMMLLGCILLGCGSGGSDKPDTSKCDEDCVASVFGKVPNFMWGAATAAAQIEGAWNISDKQASIWDDFCHNKTTKDTTDPSSFSKICGKVPAGAADPAKWTTLDVTDDFYSRHESDLNLLKSYSMNSMRVSISWPRVMPFNKTTGKHEVSQAGIAFYKKVFDEMKALGITPVVTLFHWDLPNDLSWLEDAVVDEFVAYANVVFDAFPDVTDWATFNEPNSVCSLGYAIGAFAPGHKETTGHLKCGHHILQAHAKTVASFREKRAKSGINGQIGIILDYKWAYPKTDSEDDKKAAEHDRDNVVGFWAEPIFLTGDYPQSLKDFFGSSLPVLTDDEKQSLKGSADFYGVNTYGGKIAEWNDKSLGDYKPGDDIAERYSFSPCTDLEKYKALVADPSFECGAASSWLWAKPDSMRKYLEHVHTYFKASKIYITEFGVDMKGESSMKMEDALNDNYRIDYYSRYIGQAALAKRDSNVPIEGVFAWSLMDNFEWGDGLNFRFGITYVDFNDLSRHPKNSAKWWENLIKKAQGTQADVTMIM